VSSSPVRAHAADPDEAHAILVAPAPTHIDTVATARIPKSVSTTSERGEMSDAGNGPEADDDGTDSATSGSILDDGGIDTDARAGRSLGIEPDKEPDDETKQEM
jgi:hypothetical protein